MGTFNLIRFVEAQCYAFPFTKARKCPEIVN